MPSTQYVIATVGSDQFGMIIPPAAGYVPTALGNGGVTWQAGGGGGGGVAAVSAGVGISIGGSPTNPVVVNSSPATSVHLTSSGGDVSLVASGNGPALSLAGLTAGPGIALTPGMGDVEISSTAPTLAAGAGIDVSIADGVATITATDAGAGVTLSSAGAVENTSLVVDGVGPALVVRGLAAGAGIELVVEDGDVTISSTTPTLAGGAGIDVTVADGVATITATDAGAGVTLASMGGENSTSLVGDGVGPALAVLGLSAGAGIGLAVADGEVVISSTTPTLEAGAGIDVTVIDGVATITATDSGAGVTLASVGDENSMSLVSDGVGPALAILGLAAGTGIGLAAANGEVVISSTTPTLAAGPGIDVTIADGVATITATDSGAGVTLVSMGDENSTSLVSDGVGPALAVLGLAAGAGIGLAVAGGDVVISSTSPTLAAGPGIDVAVVDGVATITATDSGAGVTLSSAGDANGVSLVSDGVGPALAVMGLTAGSGIALAVANGDVVISSTEPTLAPGAGISITVADGVATIAATDSGVSLSSAGDVGSTSLVSNGVGPAFTVMGLAAGAGIALAAADGDVVISSTEPTVSAGAGISITVADGVATIAATDPGVTLTSSGDANSTSLVSSGAGPALSVLGVAAGVGIELAVADGVLTVSNTSLDTAVTLSSAGGEVSMVIDGAGPVLTLQGLTAGAGIGLSAADGAVTISSTSSFAGGAGIDVTEADGTFTIASTAPDVSLASVGGATSLVADGTGPTLSVYSVNAGAGMGIEIVDDVLIFTNTDPGSAANISSAGGVTSLVENGVAPNFTLRGLVAGDGMAVTAADGAITLANTSPASSVTLSPAEGATGVSAIGNGAGASLTIRNFIAGTNVVIATSGTGDLVISGAAAQAGIESLSGAGGASIDMSQPDRINLDGIDVFYPSMPGTAWAQTAVSDAVAYTTNETLPLAIPCTPDFEMGFTTDAATGITTFDAGGTRPARRCQITYRLSVTPEVAAVGMLRFFVSVNGSPISLNRCEYAYSAATSTIPMSVSTKLLLSSDDTVQLTSELAGDAQTVAYSAMSCDIQGLLNDA